MLNLHAIVRGAIQAVNPDISGTWRQSSGSTQGASYKRSPSYSDSTVALQVQSAAGKDLQHPNMLNQQGVVRSVYMFGNAQGVNRVDAKGGDLLVFPQERGGTPYTWLVVAVLETWNGQWCKVGVSLQTDTPAP